jgi:hypothetical protein
VAIVFRWEEEEEELAVWECLLSLGKGVSVVV